MGLKEDIKGNKKKEEIGYERGTKER